MNWHPHADSYPILEGDEYASLKADIQARGCLEPIKVRRVNGHVQGLDGRNRERICEDLGIACPQEAVDITDGEVEAYIDSLNLHRRHLNQQQKRDMALARLKADPAQSNSKVAADVGLSDKTVASVRKEAESTSEIPKLTERKGMDGKIRPAAKAKSLCQACEHRRGLGRPLIKDCEDCEAVRKGRKIREPGDDTEAIAEDRKAEREHTKDKEGHEVPAHLREPFDNLARFEAIDSLVRQLQKGIDELARLPGGEGIRRWCRSVGDDKHTIFKTEELDKLKRHLKGERPHSVCPYCRGKGLEDCQGCRSHPGWVTKTCWDGATDAEKARLG